MNQEMSYVIFSLVNIQHVLWVKDLNFSQSLRIFCLGIWKTENEDQEFDIRK